MILEFTSGENLQESARDVTKNLKEAGLADAVFLKSVETAKWAPSTNSLLFTGSPETLSRLQILLSLSMVGLLSRVELAPLDSISTSSKILREN